MSQLKRNIAANYLGQAWVAAMGLAFIPVYIRYLGMEAYGLIGVFALLQAWLVVLDLGMTPTMTREMARFTAGAHSAQGIRDLLRSIELPCLATAVLIAGTIWYSADYISSIWLRAEKLHPAAIAQALSVMALVVAFRFMEGIYRGSLLGLQRHVLYNSTAALLATVRHGGAAAVLAWFSPTVEAFFGWQAMVSVVTVAILSVGVHRSLPRAPRQARFSADALSAVWKFAGAMLAITLLSVLLSQVDKILLSRLLTLEAFGYYVLAATLGGVIQLVVGPITQSLYPRMVELVAAGDHVALNTIYHQGARLVTVMTAPVVMLLAYFGGGVVFVWSGNAELSRVVAPLLSVLVVGSFLNGLMWIPYQCQLAHGWTRLAIASNTLAVMVLIPLLTWLVPRYGAIAGAWTWVALNAGYVLFSIQFMHRRIMKTAKWNWYGRDVLLPLFGSVLAGVLLSPLAPKEYESRGAWLLFILCAAFGALALSALLAVPPFSKIRQPAGAGEAA